MTARSMQYGMRDAEIALADGIHPEVVAVRLGVGHDDLMVLADEHGWPVTWDGTRKAIWAPEVDG